MQWKFKHRHIHNQLHLYNVLRISPTATTRRTHAWVHICYATTTVLFHCKPLQFYLTCNWKPYNQIYEITNLPSSTYSKHQWTLNVHNTHKMEPSEPQPRIILFTQKYCIFKWPNAHGLEVRWKRMAGYTVLLQLHCLLFICLHSTNPDKVTKTYRIYN